MIRSATIIARISKHFEEAKNLVRKDVNEKIVFSALAMECFQAINSAIELAELIVSERKLGFPSKYRESIELLKMNNLSAKKRQRKSSN